MSYQFKIIPKNNIEIVIPLVFELNNGKISQEVLKSRFNEMKHQNYKCAGIFKNDELVGVSGLWFCTRHYTGKSVELDHVFIKKSHRNKGLGKRFMDWIYNYAKQNDCDAMELNSYVQNFPSHKFYYNEGYEIWGYHFFKNI